jgi:hypothetical protein
VVQLRDDTTGQCWSSSLTVVKQNDADGLKIRSAP